MLPYNVLIGREGNIIWQKASYAPGEEVELRAKVVEALGSAEKADQETEAETATDKK